MQADKEISKKPLNLKPKHISELLDKALKRKEKYLSENAEYRRLENLLHQKAAGKYIGDLIYGANDGIITTFAVVAGASGASLSPIVVIILGFANLLADGISMGASNFLSVKSEQDYARAQHQKEEWEVDHLREIEIEEIREIFQSCQYLRNFYNHWCRHSLDSWQFKVSRDHC